MKKPTVYAAADQVPGDLWRWPNFKPHEIACHGSGHVMFHADAMDKLQALRDRLGRPLHITSGYRSPEHNARVRGAKRSYHMDGMAFDVSCTAAERDELADAASAVGFTGIGLYDRWVHVDTGPARRWDERTRK